MNEIDPTYLIATRVWWAWCWRAILLALGSSFLLGLVFGIIGNVVGLDKNTIASLGGIIGFFLGIFFSIFVMKKILCKSFGSFRITVMKQ